MFLCCNHIFTCSSSLCKLPWFSISAQVTSLLKNCFKSCVLPIFCPVKASTFWKIPLVVFMSPKFWSKIWGRHTILYADCFLGVPNSQMEQDTLVLNETILSSHICCSVTIRRKWLSDTVSTPNGRSSSYQQYCHLMVRAEAIFVAPCTYCWICLLHIAILPTGWECFSSNVCLVSFNLRIVRPCIFLMK